jgi:Peptidase family M50
MWVIGVFAIPSAILLWTQFAYAYDGVPSGTVLVALFLVASISGPVSALALNRSKRWGRPICWIGAAIQTLGFPLFTPFGLFGLILLGYRAGKGETESHSRGSRWVGVVARTVAACVAVILLFDGFGFWARHFHYPDDTGAVAVVLFLWASFAIQIVIHEAGHAVAAKLVGGHLHRFQIGPIWWRRESGHTWIQFFWKFPTAVGGSISWTPSSADRLARQRVWITACGPLANFVSILILLAVFPWLGDLGIPRAWTPAMFLILSGVCLLGNLQLAPVGYQMRDGGAIQGLLTNPDFRRIFEIVMRQSMSDSSGLRPKEWPRSDVDWAVGNAGRFAVMHSAVLHNACAYYLDSGDFTEAVRHARLFLDLAREQSKMCAPNGFPEAVFILAFYGNDLESARELWARRNTAEPVQFELAEHVAVASIAAADRPAAIAKAWDCSRLYGTSGTMEYLREQLQKLEIGAPVGVQL